MNFDSIESKGALIEITTNYLNIDRMNVDYLVTRESAIAKIKLAKTSTLSCYWSRICDKNTVKVLNSNFSNIMS